MEAGRFNDEIVAVEIPQRKGEPIMVDRDEHPRSDTTIDALAKLKPAFAKDGTVTAGNSSGINDGAAALLVGEHETAKRLNRWSFPMTTPFALTTRGTCLSKRR